MKRTIWFLGVIVLCSLVNNYDEGGQGHGGLCDGIGHVGLADGGGVGHGGICEGGGIQGGGYTLLDGGPFSTGGGFAYVYSPVSGDGVGHGGLCDGIGHIGRTTFQNTYADGITHAGFASQYVLIGDGGGGLAEEVGARYCINALGGGAGVEGGKPREYGGIGHVGLCDGGGHDHGGGITNQHLQFSGDGGQSGGGGICGDGGGTSGGGLMEGGSSGRGGIV